MSDKEKGRLKRLFSKETLQSRTFKHGGLATIITVLFIVAVFVVNMIVGVLNERLPMDLDLTKDKIFELTQQSIDFVKGIDRDVEISVLNTEEGFKGSDEYFTQASNVIQQYAKYNSRIKVQFVDIVKNPTFTSEYADENPQTDDIIVKSGDNHVILSAEDLFNIETTYNSYFQPVRYISASKAEQTMTSALLNVISDTKIKVSFLTGYEEADYTSLQELLEKNNFEVSVKNIVTEEIDADTKMVVIFAPSKDYDTDSLKKLDEFLSNDDNLGKTVVYIANQNLQDTTNLNAFLEEWNMQIGDGIAYRTDDSKLMTSNNPFSAFADYGSSEYTEKLPNSGIDVFMPYSKPIEATESDNVKVLLQYSSQAGIVPSDANDGGEFTAAEGMVDGAVPLAVVSTKKQYKGEETQKSNVAVIGSNMAFYSSFLSTNANNNSAYFVNMFNILAERENTITIESKSVEAARLGISAKQANTLGIIFSIVLPVLVLVIGLVVWIRRRNR
jgi:ABC-2 type transport system permease protein